MNPMIELSMAMLTITFAAVMLIAALIFDGSHGRQEQLRTIALFQHAMGRVER
jgi:hypothetical protein